MQNGYSLVNFVPFYIFIPMILIGVFELLRTPSGSSAEVAYSPQDNRHTTAADPAPWKSNRVPA